MNDQNSNPRPDDHGHEHADEHGLEALGHDHDHDHAHAHGHHHHDDPLHPEIGAPVNEDELDAAGKSLSDALRVSFVVLKVAMIALLILFVFSGTRNVEEGSVAVRLLFGAVHGSPGEQVLSPGGPYFWPPEPIGRFISVPTSARQVSLGEAFWMQGFGDVDLRYIEGTGRGSVEPGRDGSLITADKNIVHGKWAVNYRIDTENAADFITNVSASPDPRVMRQEAERVVRNAAERAVVHGAAQVTADQFVAGQVNRERIRSLIQDELDRMRAGMRIEAVLLDQPTPPILVRPAFQLVSQAESEKATKISQAERYAEQVLNQTAGESYRLLLRAIEAYEDARVREDEAAIEEADRAIFALLEEAGGEVSETLSDAVLYRRSIESALRAEAEEFARLLPEYRANPDILLSRRWEDVRQEVLGGDIEIFYVQPDGELILEFNRDPRIRRAREEARYRDEQEARLPAPVTREDYESERRRQQQQQRQRTH